MTPPAAAPASPVKTFCSTCRHTKSQHTNGIGPCIHCDVDCPRFMDLPDVAIPAAPASGLREALAYAERVIESYAMDCRNLPQYLADGNSPEGFCRGVIYREAIAHIETLAAPAAPANGLREALDRAANEGRNVLPDATDDQAAVIEQWAAALAAPAAPALDPADAWQQGYEDAWKRLHEPDAIGALDVDAMAAALELRDVQRGGSPQITPGNAFYREAAAALLACLPPRPAAPERGLDVVEHSPHCCTTRGCHVVCSHSCGTAFEAVPICACSEYCRARQPRVLAQIAAYADEHAPGEGT